MASRNLRCQKLLKNYNPTVALCSKGTGMGCILPLLNNEIDGVGRNALQDRFLSHFAENDQD